MHAEAVLIKSMIASVRAELQHVKAATEQLPTLDRWATLLACRCDISLACACTTENGKSAAANTVSYIAW